MPGNVTANVGSVRHWLSWLTCADPQPSYARATGRAVLFAAVLLTGWIVYLGAALPNAGPAQNWSTTWTGLANWQLTWVGLDVFELAGLVTSGLLLALSHRQTRTAALLAAPVFLVDGWFDVMTAPTRTEMSLSLVLLGLIEVPVAVFLLLLARHARAFEAQPTATRQ